jgi:hypothetical protein
VFVLGLQKSHRGAQVHPRRLSGGGVPSSASLREAGVNGGQQVPQWTTSPWPGSCAASASRGSTIKFGMKGAEAAWAQ